MAFTRFSKLPPLTGKQLLLRDVLHGFKTYCEIDERFEHGVINLEHAGGHGIARGAAVYGLKDLGALASTYELPSAVKAFNVVTIPGPKREQGFLMSLELTGPQTKSAFFSQAFRKAGFKIKTPKKPFAEGRGFELSVFSQPAPSGRVQHTVYLQSAEAAARFLFYLKTVVRR